MNIKLLKQTNRFTIPDGHLKGRHAALGQNGIACMRSYSGRRVWAYDAPGVPVLPSIISTVHPAHPRIKAIGYTLKAAIVRHALCTGKKLA